MYATVHRVFGFLTPLMSFLTDLPSSEALSSLWNAAILHPHNIKSNAKQRQGKGGVWMDGRLGWRNVRINN